MVRGKMILMGENPFRGPLEGLGPKNLDFFGPKVTHIKIIKSKRHMKKQVHW
jgi:hypothetical protein